MDEREKQAPPRVAVAIVTYEAAELTIDCLGSLESEVRELPGSRVIVVDNGSRDGAADRVEAAITARGWSRWAELLRSAENRGYAAGNNLAIERVRDSDAHADYVLLLNPDTVVRPGAVRVLVEFLESHPEVGIAGSRSEDPDGTPQLCCFRFPGILDELSRYLRVGVVDKLLKRFIGRVPISDEPHPIDWVSGAAMMIRSAVFDDIGLLDDGYFLYYEETDFTLRARRAGWTCWYVPQSRVIHFVGHKTGVTRSAGRPQRRPAYWFDSRRRYYLKNHGPLYAAVTDLAATSGLALCRVRQWIQRRPNNDPPRLLRDLIRNSVFVRGFGCRPFVSRTAKTCATRTACR
jgi:hypothetical protein